MDSSYNRPLLYRANALFIGAFYVIATLLLIFILGILLYQYIAMLGSLSQVLNAFLSPRILMALWLSVSSAVVTTLLGLFFGVPLGYLFAMKEFKGKEILETLAIDVPQTFPPVAEGMILLLMLGPSSPFHIDLSKTFTALVIAKFFICAPFVISFTTRRFKEIKQTGLNITARTLGASPAQTFFTIFLPLSLKDIIAGTSLCWSRAMGELGGSLIFAGVIPFKTEDIPTFIATQATSLTTLSLAATIAVTTSSMIALIIFKKLGAR